MSVYRVPLSIEAATFARDALAKRVYQRCFDWIVEQARPSPTIGSPTVLSAAPLFAAPHKETGIPRLSAPFLA